jgi:hypothetical protein
MIPTVDQLTYTFEYSKLGVATEVVDLTSMFEQSESGCTEDFTESKYVFRVG